MANEDKYILRGLTDRPVIKDIDLYSLLTERWADNHHNTAVIHEEDDEKYRLTYGQLDDVIKAVSRDMLGAGLGFGVVVSVWCSNSAHIPIVSLAAWRIGAVASLVGASLTAEEAWRLIKKVDTVLLLIDPATKVKAAQVIPDINNKIVFKVEGYEMISLRNPRPGGQASSLPHPGAPGVPEVPARPSGINLDDTAIILFSSGTTGLPKAVELTHRNLVTAFTIIAEEPFGRRMLGAAVHFLPLSHFYGQFLLFRILQSCATVVLMKRFNLDRYLQLISKYQAAMMFLVPPVAVQLVKNPDILRRYDLSKIVGIFAGAAVLPPEVIEQLYQIFCNLNINFRLTQSYGLTETSGGFTRFRLDTTQEAPRTSVGQLIPYMELKIIDVNTGKPLPTNSTGEILTRGRCVMKGYRGDPRATSEIIDKEGWLHTGDIGYYDDQGFIYVVDRLKELIKHKGMQVAPAELEDILLSHPDVEDAAVVGLEDELAGEKPLAFVVRRAGSRVIESDIIKYIADRVASYKQLTGGVRFIDSIPHLPSGKILRRNLKNLINKSKL